MGATSGVHTVVEGVMTNPSSRTRVHRLAEFVLEIEAEAALAETLSRVVHQEVPELQLGQEAADSDPPGKSITSLVEGATQEFVG